MDHDAGIRQRLPFARAARSQQKRSHRCCHAETDGRDIARNKLEGTATEKERYIGMKVRFSHQLAQNAGRRMTADRVRSEQILGPESLGKSCLRCSKNKTQIVVVSAFLATFSTDDSAKLGAHVLDGQRTAVGGSRSL